MNRLNRTLSLIALMVNILPFVAHAQIGRYVETDLVVNGQLNTVPTLVDSNGITHVAKFFDEHLVNPWGIAESSTSAFWLSQAGAGVASLYNTAGAPQPLVVSIPSAANPLGTEGIPTGAVFNPDNGPTGGFKISGLDKNGQPVTASAIFLFATKDGTVLGWNPTVNPSGFDPAKAGMYAIVAINNTDSAAYTGLALVTSSDGTTRLYAANFGARKVDVFDTSFNEVVPSNNAFVDQTLAPGYAPFNIAPVTMNGTTRLFVTYANPTDVFGQGHGFVNTFQLDGSAPKRFAQRGQLNAPWGIVLTPSGFGELGGTLWIGNFGDGRINAYDPNTGEFVNKVRTSDGKAIVIDGLWTIRFGNGGNGGSLGTLYFTAGPNGERDGIFGSLDPK